MPNRSCNAAFVRKPGLIVALKLLMALYLQRLPVAATINAPAGFASFTRLQKNADMRTSLDLPDPLFRHLKARAALAHSSGLRLVTFDRDLERFGPARWRVLPLV